MLQTQSVNPKLLEFLTKIMSNQEFDNFNLVGGTALALLFGHRVSIDIDLFGNQNLEYLSILEYLNSLGKTNLLQKSKNIQIYSVDSIKIDFVNYTYPLLEKPLIFDSLRIVSLKDIAAMKLNAIAGRGTKKDFIDIYFLLKNFTLQEMLTFYNQKYHDGSDFLVLRSLNYFEDADLDITPKLFSLISWEEIKTEITLQVRKLEG